MARKRLAGLTLVRVIRCEMLEDGSPVTVSVGITTWRDRDTVDGMLLRVDQAMYQAKREGRNRVRVAGTAAPVVPVPVAE